MKILVTGGAGFIGSHTIVELIKSGYECVSIDNFSNSEPFIFDRIEKITGAQIENCNIDLTDFDKVSEIFESEKFDGVIHFAAYKAVGESMEDPAKYYRNNLGKLYKFLVNGNKPITISNPLFTLFKRIKTNNKLYF